jgi:phenylpropionate dioxygenase-like ring-hydroxylating dioxygenase large terminal subunit
VSLNRALELFWHPVCTLDELAASGERPLAVQLLDRPIAVADLGDGRIAAVADRCLHRSTRLSIGWVDNGAIRCAYHGWRWAADGRCVEIPSLPEGPIPNRACIESYDATVEYGLVWVRIDSSAGTKVPACPAWTDAAMRIVPGDPYTWPTGAPRRVENFVDLAHFAWVHDGTLGRRDQPVPPMPDIARIRGELRFSFDPPEMETDEVALFGHSRYRLPMPLTVDIDFTMADGARRHLWMTASPVTAGSCRSFWLVARTDRHDEDDAVHLAFQALVLAEDEPVVCNQDPPDLRLEPGFELSVRTDKVSIEYRRWLRELADAATTDEPGDAVRDALEDRSEVEVAS